MTQMHQQNYINGQWVGEGRETFDVMNPATGQVIGTMPDGTAEDVKQAVDAAHEAFTDWRNLTAEQRGDYLLKVYDLMMADKEELAKVMTLEMVSR